MLPRPEEMQNDAVLYDQLNRLLEFLSSIPEAWLTASHKEFSEKDLAEMLFGNYLDHVAAQLKDAKSLPYFSDVKLAVLLFKKCGNTLFGFKTLPSLTDKIDFLYGLYIGFGLDSTKPEDFQPLTPINSGSSIGSSASYAGSSGEVAEREEQPKKRKCVLINAPLKHKTDRPYNGLLRKLTFHRRKYTTFTEESDPEVSFNSRK